MAGLLIGTAGATGDVTLTGTQTLTNKTLTTPTVGDMSNYTFPTGHVIYHSSGSLSADSNVTANAAWHSVTNSTITVPAATCNVCSKIVIYWSATTLQYCGTSHHFCDFRCYRTTPNATQIGQLARVGVNGTVLTGPGATWRGYTLLGTDASLSNADHTYIIQKIGPDISSSVCQDVSGSAKGTNVSVWGLK